MLTSPTQQLIDELFDSLSQYTQSDWNTVTSTVYARTKPPKNHAWLRNKNASIETPASVTRARQFSANMTRFRNIVIDAAKDSRLRVSQEQFVSIMKYAQATMRAMVSKDIIPEDDYNAHAHWFDVEGKWPIAVLIQWHTS